MGSQRTQLPDRVYRNAQHATKEYIPRVHVFDDYEDYEERLTLAGLVCMPPHQPNRYEFNCHTYGATVYTLNPIMTM